MGSQIRTAVMERNVRRIKSDGTAGAQTRALRTDLLEIAQPEFRVIVPGIIFSEGNLDPAIGASLPGAFRRPFRPGLRGGGQPHNSRCCGNCPQPQQVAATDGRHSHSIPIASLTSRSARTRLAENTAEVVSLVRRASMASSARCPTVRT